MGFSRCGRFPIFRMFPKRNFLPEDAQTKCPACNGGISLAQNRKLQQWRPSKVTLKTGYLARNSALRFLPLTPKSPAKSEVFPAPSAREVHVGLPSSREVHREVRGSSQRDRSPSRSPWSSRGLRSPWTSRGLPSQTILIAPGQYQGGRCLPCFNYLVPIGNGHRDSQVSGRVVVSCCIGDNATGPQPPCRMAVGASLDTAGRRSRAYGWS